MEIWVPTWQLTSVRSSHRPQERTEAVSGVDRYCWWFRNPAPVAVVDIPVFKGFYTPQVVVWDFWTINSIPVFCFFFGGGGKGCREKNVGLQGPRSQCSFLGRWSWTWWLPQWNQPAQVIGRMFFNQKQLVCKLPTNPPNSKPPSDSSVINSLRSSSELVAPKIKPSELWQVAACCTWNSSLASSCCFIEFFRP